MRSTFLAGVVGALLWLWPQPSQAQACTEGCLEVHSEDGQSHGFGCIDYGLETGYTECHATSNGCERETCDPQMALLDASGIPSILVKGCVTTQLSSADWIVLHTLEELSRSARQRAEPRPTEHAVEGG